MSSTRGQVPPNRGGMPPNRGSTPSNKGATRTNIGANPAGQGTATNKMKDVIGRYESIPRRTRIIGSSLFFLFCLGGLYWTDYLESKYPPTEKQKQQIEELKSVRFPSKQDFEQAREQAMRAQARVEGASVPKK